MKKNFREFVSIFGLTRNVASVANGGFLHKCLVVSLFFLLTLPLLPFSAKGQTQVSVPAGEIQEQMTTSPIPSSRYMAPWDLKAWGSVLFPHITITSAGVKVEAYDPYRISCHGRVQLVVSSCETGAIVYQTLMEADSSCQEGPAPIVANCPKHFFSDENGYFFNLYEIDHGKLSLLSGVEAPISFD